MRIVAFTGKGGVGKSTLAAGTAVAAAEAGRRTLVLSTDAAHSLSDAFGVALDTDPDGRAVPTEIAPGLFVAQVDAQRRFEASWADIQGYLLSVLDVAGLDPIAAEELSVIPGAEEVLALLELREHALSEEWDAIVLDCAPTAETLRLLALPEALGWYMQRIFPTQARVMRALRPVLSRAAGVPMPGGSVFDAIERLHHDLDEVRALLTGPDASVRLVLTPEQVVLAEARRSYTTLSLFGYRVDGVVANRIFPAEGADDWRTGWVLAQDAVLADVARSFPALPLWRSAYRSGEPVGVQALAALATEVYGDDDPLTVPEGLDPMRVTRDRDGATLHLALPHAARSDVALARHGDELVLDVGPYRRLLTLPAALARMRVAGAGVQEGELRVRFTEPASSAEADSRSGASRSSGEVSS